MSEFDPTNQKIVKPIINTGKASQKEKGFFDYLTERTGIMNEVYNSRELMRDIEAGLDTREMKSKYIKAFSKEPQDNYNKRVDDSIFYNITNRMIKINYNRPFGKPAQITSTDDFLASLQEDFDGFGNSLTDFGKKFFKRSLYDSQAHVFVDLPVNLDENGKSVFNPDVTPNAFVLDNDRILGARVNSNGEVVHLRFATEEESPHFENPFDVQMIKTIYVFDKIGDEVYYNVFRQISDDAFEADFDYDIESRTFSTQVHPLGYIPLISFYPEDTENAFYPDIIFKDLANKNIEYFRSSSDQTNILHVARVPILFLKGMPENHSGISIGASAALVADEAAENADAKYVEVNGNSINAGRQNMNDIITQMESLGLELMTKKSNVTATASSIDNAQNLSLLTAFAMKLQDRLIDVVKVFMDFKKVSGYNFTSEDFTLQIDTKFSVVVEQQELQFMQFLRSSGDISGKTITDYAKRLGYLPSNYDYQDDMENTMSMGTMASSFGIVDNQVVVEDQVDPDVE